VTTHLSFMIPTDDAKQTTDTMSRQIESRLAFCTFGMFIIGMG
jgi:hypothetical protein